LYILKTVFAEARRTGSMIPVFEPFIQAELFVIGVVDAGGTPNIMLRSSPTPGNMCATVSEQRDWLKNVPQDRCLPITGRKLIELLGNRRDVVVIYADGGDLLQHEYVEIFRDALD
jgi:hypothetical protein